MALEIITIGDEILIGQIVDTNSAWMGKALNNAGFAVSRITSVQDTSEAICAALDEALRRSDVVLITGGLGPTKDDITKHTLAEYFGSKLVFNEEVYANVCQLLEGRVTSINALNRGQAMVPENCVVIHNPVGTAPVMWFEKDKKVVVSMPGVPGEMKQAMAAEIIPRLQKIFRTQHIIHKTILVYNVPESVLAEQLSEWEERMPDYIRLAYLPSPGRIRLRLSAQCDDKDKALKDIHTLVEDLYGLVGQHIYGEEDVAMEELLGEVLRQKGRTLAVAESCTGGFIGHRMTSIPGSSAYFKGGIIAYENRVKEKLLNVRNGDLEVFGAVSRPVVEQMAEGVRQALGSDYSIATSGIAGPDGGSDEKPVGTVWIAIAGDFGVLSKKYNFGKIRERNIQRAADAAMMLLLNRLKKG